MKIQHNLNEQGRSISTDYFSPDATKKWPQMRRRRRELHTDWL